MLSCSKIVLFALVASFTVNQVFSVECYFCHTLKGGECDTNPTKKDHRADCDKVGSSVLGTKNFAREMDCMKITGENSDGDGTVMRTCAYKAKSCEEYSKDLLELSQSIIVKSCDRCSTNLCNSSGNLKIAIWSFAISMIISLASIM